MVKSLWLALECIPYSYMLTKDTLGVKSEKQYASRQVQKALISAEAKKLLYQKYF